MLVKNGIIIDPSGNRIFPGELLLRDGLIEAVSQTPGAFRDAPDEVIDAAGLMIAPGLIDTHVHFRDPGFTHKEDILTGAEAAKAGGFTGVVMMANTNPRIDNTETLRYVLDKGAKTGIRVYSCANVTIGMEGKILTDLSGLREEGAVGFTDDGIPLTDEKLVYEAMKRCAELGVPVSFHEEDPSLIENNGINRGEASSYFGIGGSPREAESTMIARDIALAERLFRETGNKVTVVIQHISTKEGVGLVRKAKKTGLCIHAEATPHHFSLTEKALMESGTNAKMNPPLRTEEDRLAILEGLKDGTIDLIATDHAPHTAEEKSAELTKAPSGIIGLETSLSLAIRSLVEPGILSFPSLLKKMSENPARLYGIPGGSIASGAPADLVLFDPKEERTVTEESLHSRSKNTPFLGRKLPGVVHFTICGGNIVYALR